MQDLSRANHDLSESRLATPEAIRELRNLIAEYAIAIGISPARADDIRLAVSEAVTNVVMHAYRDEPGSVQALARVTGNELWVLITDEGVGNNVPTERPGLGFGLALIAEVSDGFTLVERAERGTEARMRFGIADKRPDITHVDR